MKCIKGWRCVSESCIMIRLWVAVVWMMHMHVQVYAPQMTETHSAQWYRVPRGDKVVYSAGQLYIMGE